MNNLNDIIRFLKGTEKGKELLKTAREVLDKVEAGDDLLKGAFEDAPRRASPGPQAPVVKGGMSPVEARAVLHFGADQKLTPALIKARKRDLAKMVHPDTGGDTGAAARINAAADVLLKGVKR